MRSIQDVGTEILTNNPGKLYIMCGKEYGIKCKYMSLLAKHYNGNVISYPRMSELINFCKTKHILPVPPSLFVVRYDEEFVSHLNSETGKLISDLNVPGTIVCIYEGHKVSDKLNKYLPDYCVTIDSVEPKFVFKYLKSDYSKINDDTIFNIIKISSDYGQAQNICRCLSKLPFDQINSLTFDDLSHIFGHTSESTDKHIKLGIAGKDFNYLNYHISKYPEDKSSILYLFLSTMVDLDKLLDNKHIDSELRPYVKLWQREDVYNMFMHSYRILSISRGSYNVDLDNLIIYLSAICCLGKIPSLEVLQ